MRHTPILTYDPRTIRHLGRELRQVGTKPGFPIKIESRKIGENAWYCPQGDSAHIQEFWDIAVRDGKVVS